MLLGNQILTSNLDLAMQASVVFPPLLASEQSAPLLHQMVVFTKTVPSNVTLTLFLRASRYPSHTIIRLQLCYFLRPIKMWQLFGATRPIIVSVFNKTMSTALNATRPSGKVCLVGMEHSVMTVPLTPATARKYVISDEGTMTCAHRLRCVFNLPLQNFQSSNSAANGYNLATSFPNIYATSSADMGSGQGGSA
ncbi:hypothetical protein C1H46_010394 [Malus baccata]|uniref:Uncharacterized protein n=1 Tax=Malus baccata TaxID=106549 RepID=A0A540N0H8_MALBA|nr:hypothetical protein C1H46_010394 [Malus baccata]